MSWFWKKKVEEKVSPPEDEVEYFAGFSCPNKHAGLCSSTGEITSGVRICRHCGEESRPSVIRVTWQYFPGAYNTTHRWASGEEFVRFLDKKDTVELKQETILKLQEMSSRDFLNEADDLHQCYLNGLKDGAVMTAQLLLEEIKEESK